MKRKQEARLMRRTLLLGIALLLLPIASIADLFENGTVNEVGYTVSGDSIVRDSVGGDPTTVNLRLGADATGGPIQVQENSVLNIFAGALVSQPRYEDSSSGAICSGTVQQLLINGEAPVVEVSGGAFTASSAAPVRLVSGTLTIQGGSFENTAGGTVVALDLSTGVAEVRGGTVVNGIVRLGPTVQATISGGDYGSNSINNQLGGTLTIVGASFNLPFGEVSPGTFHNGPLTGTLADGSPIDTTLVKSPGSDVFLVEGTQGPLSSTVCGLVPTNVPALPTWAIGLAVMALAATGTLLGRRLQRAD
jgi:hypothetical protein